jgi:chromosome segregation ATPase
MLFFALKNTGRINSQKKMINDLQTVIDSQTKADGELLGAIESAEQVVTDLRTRKTQLEGDLETEKTARADAETKLAESENKNQELNGELTNAKEEIATLSEKNQSQAATIDEQSQKIAKTEADLSAANEKATKLKSEKTELARKLSLLQNLPPNPETVAELTMKIEDLTAANKKRYDTLSSKYSAECRKTAELTKQVNKFKESYKNAKGNITSVQSLGLTAIGFEGPFAPKEGDVFPIWRGEEKIGDLTIGNIFHTILICQRKVAEAEGELKKGDVLKLNPEIDN